MPVRVEVEADGSAEDMADLVVMPQGQQLAALELALQFPVVPEEQALAVWGHPVGSAEVYQTTSLTRFLSRLPSVSNWLLLKVNTTIIFHRRR
jgi:hypothetical protein